MAGIIQKVLLRLNLFKKVKVIEFYVFKIYQKFTREIKNGKFKKS